MQALVQYFLDRGIFVNLLTSLLILMGGYIALTMNREAFPNIDFDIVVITTIYPGASPEEVEKLVTNPIEETIKEVDGIEEYKSVSITNRSQITMKIDPDVERALCLVLAKDPERRFRSATMFAAALADAAVGRLDDRLREHADRLIREQPWGREIR